ncbi:hypothetical protein GCM10022233_61350 [Streptomyces shaanxiensis]|uniref:Uncharacterized protein n=1 Tax=Streptomyces shaanxiensis TaxID=653357 RepID=A0ABP7VVR9_9ACTN
MLVPRTADFGPTVVPRHPASHLVRRIPPTEAATGRARYHYSAGSRARRAETYGGIRVRVVKCRTTVPWW